MKLDEALERCPAVAILRGVRPDEILDHTEALKQAGMFGVEVPLNSPEPLVSIARMSEAFGTDMACGAGTVLSAEMVDAAAVAGARLIISPNTDTVVIARAVELGLDAAPGFATASEAFRALQAGARHLKLFPASTYGPGHVRQLKAVLPATAVLWAVGGVGAAEMADYWAAGVRAFGIGSEVYRPGQPAEETGRKARKLVEAARSLAR